MKPVFRLGSVYVVTRYDDVWEVFRNNHALDTPYKANIDALTGREPIFLALRFTISLWPAARDPSARRIDCHRGLFIGNDGSPTPKRTWDF